MRAWLLERLCDVSIEDHPLTLGNIPTPTPAEHEILICVHACGVCHTELDEIEGRMPPPKLPVVPGHQIVGSVVGMGAHVTLHQEGDRVGVGWIHHSNGTASENLDPEFVATGRDSQGGYAEYVCVPENYAYPIPQKLADDQAAPLLCAGAIGYRSLRLTNIQNQQVLGLTGFGGSAHLVLQLAKYLYPQTPVYVFARNPAVQEFALSLGADWAGDIKDTPPTPMHAVIDTTPAWTPILYALTNLHPNGRLVINAIRKEDSDKQILQQLSYHTHLWMEREIKSVANITSYDIREFLPLAAAADLTAEVETYPLDQANQALTDLKRKPVRGTKVLVV